jgi:putative copper resistance protein D
MHDHMHHATGAPPPPDPLSLFNHHLAGWMLILVAVFGVLELSPLKKYDWIRQLWPLPLIFLAMVMLLRSDREHLSDLTLANVLSDPEELQHKLFALLALAIGFLELLRRTGRLKHLLWSYVLYSAVIAGGIFLLFHGGQHSEAVHKQHLWMGTTALAIGITKTVGDLSTRLVWPRLVLASLFLALGTELVRYYE